MNFIESAQEMTLSLFQGVFVCGCYYIHLIHLD